MNTSKNLVLDANILLRAVFGARVRDLLEGYEDIVSFYSPEVCFEEAAKHLPAIADRKRLQLSTSLLALEKLQNIVQVVDRRFYWKHEEAAHERIALRDANDWPVVATCLLLDCPVWTEDQDFFGCGVSTWTTNNVEIYLRAN
jgi:predicted nucleic acid-binding protein